jgi:hypothetical protein
VGLLDDPVFFAPFAGCFDARIGRPSFPMENVSAIRLTVSGEMVKTRVSWVLSKLELRDRTQSVVTAYETGLVVPGSHELSCNPSCQLLFTGGTIFGVAIDVSDEAYLDLVCEAAGAFARD